MNNGLEFCKNKRKPNQSKRGKMFAAAGFKLFQLSYSIVKCSAMPCDLVVRKE